MNEKPSLNSEIMQFDAAGKLTKYDATVIWITGFSGAGKTTVGRKVNSRLQAMGVNSVFLDGDDLRGIFGEKWGFEKNDRIELAHIYFRLCNSLASQGITVVISAVAMYEEIYTWIETNIDRSLQVYLKVPLQERVNRDKLTKNIYSGVGDFKKLYDEPTSPDLIIENYGTTSPDRAAAAIIDAYKTVEKRRESDKGRSAHWNDYYQNSKLIFEPSSFALLVSDFLTNPVDIIEMGCGNGRDSAYFGSLGHRVTALDPSIEAIKLCQSKYSNAEFINGTFLSLDSRYNSSFDIVYSRFCIHAMTEKEEVDNLNIAYRILKQNGSFFIECRSINDPLSRKGEVISPTERIFGHYRRFIVMDEFAKRLADAGFSIVSAVESDNVAALGDDNPVVIRIHAKK